MWIGAESTGEHPQIMCSVFQRNRNFSSLLLVPMLWNVACDDAGKGMSFLGGGVGSGECQRLRFTSQKLCLLAVIPWTSHLASIFSFHHL